MVEYGILPRSNNLFIQFEEM